MKLKTYIKEEIEKGDRMRCDVCGREVKVNIKGKGPLVCCGENMKKI